MSWCVGVVSSQDSSKQVQRPVSQVDQDRGFVGDGWMGGGVVGERR